MKKNLFFGGITFLIAISMLSLSVSATVDLHAQLEGLAIVKTGGGRPDIDRNAVLTFYKLTYDGTWGEPYWAVTLDTDDIVYVWLVTQLKVCGESDTVIMKAIPDSGWLSDQTEGPTNIQIILNHDSGHPIAVVNGKGVLFVGRTVIPA